MPFYPEGGDGTPQDHPNAAFVAQWRDYDEVTVRVCPFHLPAMVRKLYDQFGFVFPVEVYLLNDNSGFPCEYEE